PLRDRRWTPFVAGHPEATVFHTAGWLQTLHQTYGYEAFALTTNPPGAELTNAMVFCRVNSWLTGSRWVSLPFSDHCAPLVSNPRDLLSILDWAQWESARLHHKYIEIRPRNSTVLRDSTANLHCSQDFRLHLLDLNPDLDQLFRTFDKNSVQRRIRRSEKEDLRYEEGRSPELLEKFYHLMIMTRRRHGVPPQPLAWYRNLLHLVGNSATLRVVSKGNVPVASIMTIRHGTSVVYKYGCSDARYNNLGATVLLFWRAIQGAKQSGAQVFDMGRSDVENQGLIKFKSNWGTTDLPLTYWRSPKLSAARDRRWPTGRRIASSFLCRLPNSCLTLMGNALYKHAG